MIELLKLIYEYRIIHIVVGLYFFYKFGTHKHNLHLKLGHKGPNPLPFFGNFIDIFLVGIHEFDRKCLKKYGKIYPFYFGNIKMAMVADEKLLKQILIKESKCFTDRLNIGLSGKTTDKFLTRLKGKDWERVRNLVTPTFTSGKMRKMSPLISDSVDLLEERIANYPTDKPIDFKDFFGALTMDVIARTMFGMKVDSQSNTNNQFMVNGKKLFSVNFLNPIVLLFVIFPELVSWFRKIMPNWDIFGQKTLLFFTSNLTKNINEREESLEKYNDFLALMLKAKKDIAENDGDKSGNLDSKSLTNEEIMAQSLIFLLAGYETTSITLTYLAYFLATNPSAQDEVYNEIMDKIGNKGTINYEILMNMPILEAALKETLRICPALARIDRVCTQDIILTTSDNKKIMAKKGDIFVAPVFAIHHDPSIWPDPEKYDLHRFDADNLKSHSAYSYMPFGMGPRNCVGMRFALLEVKWAIVNILQKFEIVPCTETVKCMQFRKSALTTPLKPIILKVNQRK